MKRFLLLYTFLCLALSGFSQKATHEFSMNENSFLLDGKPFQIISGEMHYPRVPREAWRQRMKMARAMGLNTIGTYVFWNIHEPLKGVYDFSGNNDVAAFVKMAKEEGLYVILRPSPYVCAEWEFGGYPFWLQNEKDLLVRSKNPQYLEAYKHYLTEVGKQLAPLQINHGGNVLMVQVENEYGSYGNDKAYLDINRKMFIDAGFDGLLYTCDPANDISAGHLKGLYAAVNGEDRPSKVKELIRKNNEGKGPFMIAEWYPAWFDWWGAKHHTVPASKYVTRLDSVLAAGISINMYMFHGGTTRGFMNGANVSVKNPYEPQISSYDYDAPLDEAGNATDKFMQFRAVIQKYLPQGQTLPAVPEKKKAIRIDQIKLTESAGLWDLLPAPVKSEQLLTFEALQQAYGFVLYRTEFENATSGILSIKDLRDYGIVFVNGVKQGVLDRRLRQDSLLIQLPQGKARIDILVENLGRVNFGPFLLQNKKGITQKVTLNQTELKHWSMYRLPFDRVGGSQPLKQQQHLPGTPVLKKGSFDLKETGDTYLDMQQWGKGVVWINGHNLGRYWSIGPQQTMYVPAEWLHKGKNEIMVFELLKSEQQELKAIDMPILDKINTSN